jgi:transcriptional regulator with XRE-family HTH domain
VISNSNRPPVPPDAAVIRLAREGAGISMAHAAERARMSKARWVQIENGRETRRGQVRPVRAKPVTIAHMAHAVNLPPERLESEGRNPEAAAILREIISQEDTRPSIDAQRIAQGRPYADEIYARLLRLAAIGNLNPSGNEVFPDSERDAWTWDARADKTVQERVWLIATVNLRLAEQRQSH